MMKIYDNEVDNTERLFSLDLMRALAIILVVISHLSALLFPKQFQFFAIHYFGTMGVEIFFVLSGFLIGTIIIKIFNEQECFEFKQIKNFWVRRWFRTLPNYYLVLIISFIFSYFFYDIFVLKDIRFFAYFVFLQSVITSHPSFFSVAWSLVIEEWFYLLYPIGLLVLSKLKFNKYKTLILSAVALTLVVSLLRIILALSYPNLQWDNVFHKIMPLRIDSIAMGVLTAIIYFYKKDFLNKHKIKLFIIGFILLIGCSLFFYFDFILLEQQLAPSSFIMKTFFFNILELSIAFLFPFIISMKRLKNEKIVRFITHISLISYSVYLIHLIIIALLSNLPISNLYKVTLAFIIIFAIASLQYKYFEKPMTLLRERFEIEKTREMKVKKVDAGQT